MVADKGHPPPPVTLTKVCGGEGGGSATVSKLTKVCGGGGSSATVSKLTYSIYRRQNKAETLCLIFRGGRRRWVTLIGHHTYKHLSLHGLLSLYVLRAFKRNFEVFIH